MSDTQRIPTPTWGCLEECLETIWAALELIPEGTLTDDEYGDVKTAMGWLTEATEHADI